MQRADRVPVQRFQQAPRATATSPGKARMPDITRDRGIDRGTINRAPATSRVTPQRTTTRDRIDKGTTAFRRDGQFTAQQRDGLSHTPIQRLSPTQSRTFDRGKDRVGGRDWNERDAFGRHRGGEDNWDQRRGDRWNGDRYDRWDDRHGHHGHHGYHHRYYPYYRYGYLYRPYYYYRPYYRYHDYYGLDYYAFSPYYSFYAGLYTPSYGYVNYVYDDYPTTYTTVYQQPVAEQVVTQQTYPSTTYETPTYYTEPAQPQSTYVETPAEAVDQSTSEIPRSAQLVEQGNEQFKRGQYDAARQLYMEATLADDEDGYAKLFYSMASVALGDYEAAASALRRALTTSPELVHAPIDLRQFYGDRLQAEAQVNRLSDHVRANSQDFEARFLLGYYLYATGDAEQGHAVLKLLSAEAPADDLASLTRDAINRVLKAPVPTEQVGPPQPASP